MQSPSSVQDVYDGRGWASALIDMQEGLRRLQVKMDAFANKTSLQELSRKVQDKADLLDTAFGRIAAVNQSMQVVDDNLSVLARDIHAIVKPKVTDLFDRTQVLEKTVAAAGEDVYGLLRSLAELKEHLHRQLQPGLQELKNDFSVLAVKNSELENRLVELQGFSERTKVSVADLEASVESDRRNVKKGLEFMKKHVDSLASMVGDVDNRTNTHTPHVKNLSMKLGQLRAAVECEVRHQQSFQETHATALPAIKDHEERLMALERRTVEMRSKLPAF